MEEQREKSRSVGDCREPMKEAGLSSKVQTLVGEDDNTVKVSNLGVSDVSEADASLKAANGKVGDSVSVVGSVEDVVETKDNVEESNVVSSVSGEVETKVNAEKTVSSDDVERAVAITERETERNGMDVDAGAVVVKPVEGSKLCKDVQRVSEMKKGENLELFPTDLITEMFSRLPAKSAARFRILSKQWESILSSPDFKELFLAKSRARPRLLFAVFRYGQWSFFSSPQPQYSSDKPLVLAADFHTKFSGDASRYPCSYASGLLFFPDMFIPGEGRYSLPVLRSPVTGQYKSLPYVSVGRHCRSFLGFDPIEKQFKVLTEGDRFAREKNRHQVLTLETGELSWRSKPDCPRYSGCLCEATCIDGVLYFLADHVLDLPRALVCFDVRTEEFKFVAAECFTDPTATKLVSYKGKLGGVNCKYVKVDGRHSLELCMWVLEDVEQQEWSHHVYTFWDDKLGYPCNASVAGVTSNGEIVLSLGYTCKPFYVFYFSPERNTLQSVEIQGFGAKFEAVGTRGRVHAFLDHVEDLSVYDAVAKHLKSSVSPPSTCEEEEDEPSCH
ncbi:unnamed protein product [Microthlaspi erraticum]|uniref:F-box domain-containing protein n=1 Tax=Microthlaspi erraticum TaxID=1685480 RepID=A0A6D2KNX2_9BRAS|nr:unnamed protein product [Microthlaspi erraticum]